MDITELEISGRCAKDWIAKSHEDIVVKPFHFKNGIYKLLKNQVKLILGRGRWSSNEDCPDETDSRNATEFITQDLGDDRDNYDLPWRPISRPSDGILVPEIRIDPPTDDSSDNLEYVNSDIFDQSREWPRNEPLKKNKLARSILLSKESIDLFKLDSESSNESWESASELGPKSGDNLAQTDLIVPFSALHSSVQKCLNIELEGTMKKKLSFFNSPKSTAMATEVEDFSIKPKSIFWDKIIGLANTLELTKDKCKVCNNLDPKPENKSEICEWPCPKFYPLITQSPTWSPIGIAIPMSFNTNQETPRFENWETSLYCRFIPFESKLFHEFCFKFQKDLSKTAYSLSIATLRSFLSMRRQLFVIDEQHSKSYEKSDWIRVSDREWILKLKSLNGNIILPDKWLQELKAAELHASRTAVSRDIDVKHFDSRY